MAKERYTPRPHQRDAISDALKVLRKEDRATVLMACGTGKTLVGMWVTEALAHKTVIVFVPSIALIQQVMREWLGATKMKAAWMAVCSDPSVSVEEDAIQISPEDMEFHISTSPDDVRRFLDSATIGPKLIFCTYDSARVVSKVMRSGERFDAGIFDEAHKTAGRVGRKYSFALLDKNLRIKKRLFMTATPRHYDFRRRGKDGEMAEVFSMDSREVYGQVAHELSYRKAVDLGLVVKFKVIFSTVVSRDLGRKRLKDGHVVIRRNKVSARLVAGKVALLHAMKSTGALKAFSFHDRVLDAQEFADVVRGGAMKALHVNGIMPASLRAHELEEFDRAPRAVVTNARCLTEGVDVPAVDMVAFMSPRRSRVDIVQAVGRCVRNSPGKKTGFVFVHLLVEANKGESREHAIQRKRFDMVFDVLEALRESDSAISDKMRIIAQEFGETGRISPDCLDGFVSVIGGGIGFTEMKRGITTRLVREMSSCWDVRYGQLVAFKQRHGHTNVAESQDEKLARWARQQRGGYAAGKLSKDRICRLEKIGFRWVLQEEKWNAMCEELSKYKAKHGDANPPAVCQENPRLGQWVNNQRSAYKRGELSGDRIKKLEALGILWRRPLRQRTLRERLSWRRKSQPSADEVWNIEYAKVKEIYKKGEDVNVLYMYMDTALWCANQRKHYRSKSISDEQIKKLESLGFRWEI